MFLLGSVIFSAAAFIIAAQSGMQTADSRKPIYRRILSGAESVLCIVYGLSFLVIPQSTVFAYSISIGYILIADALIRLLFVIYEDLKASA